MVTKSITVVQESGKCRYWTLSNQAAMDNLLRRYKVDVLIDSEYACEVGRYISLVDGMTYTLGDSFSSSVELQDWSGGGCNKAASGKTVGKERAISTTTTSPSPDNETVHNVTPTNDPKFIAIDLDDETLDRAIATIPTMSF